MSHAHEPGVGARGPGAGREANLLGAVSLAISGRLRQATEAGTGAGGSAPAALISLAGYLDGGPIDSLRDPLGLTHSAAVRVVDGLVAADLARRRPGRDGRSVAVELTAAGRKAAAAALSAREGSLESALNALSSDERAELMRLNEKLLAGLTDGRATARNICRLCDLHACGHNEGICPVTNAADAVS